MKKLLLSMLSILVLGVAAASAARITSGGLIYEVNDYDEATVVGCADTEANTVTIPYVFNYDIDGQQYMFFVTSIAENALADSKMTTLVFAEKTYAGAASQGNLVIAANAFNTPTLTTIVIDREDVPEVDGDPFSQETYDKGSISFGDNLTEAQKQAYLDAEPWNKIGNGGTSSVVGIETDAAPAEYYTPGGIRVDNPGAGIYIVRRGTHIAKQVIR